MSFAAHLMLLMLESKFLSIVFITDVGLRFGTLGVLLCQSDR